MVIEWHESEHEDVDKDVQGDLKAQQDLRACGLYKLWRLGFLTAKPRLLQMLVDYWDPDTETFQLDGMPLSLEVEDIYFIIGLSRRGMVVNLRARGLGGGLRIEEYITIYCLLNMEKVGSQIPTNSIQNLGLKEILLVLGRISRLASLHQAYRPLIFYAVECISPTIYDWSTSLLGNMKQQLTYYKMKRVRNFGFTSILTNFFFERVLKLSPRVDITAHGSWDPS